MSDQSQGPSPEVELKKIPEDEIPDLSDESLDELILEDDPQFASSVMKIAGDKELSVSAEELIIPANSSAAVGILKLKFNRIKETLIYFLTDGRNEIIKTLKAWIDRKHTENRDAYYRFKMLSIKTRLQLAGLLLAIIVATGGLGLLLKTRYLSKDEPLFLQDLAGVADQTWTFATDSEMEPFYDNVKISLHILVIEKLVVNLKPQTNPNAKTKGSANPMAAFEFYLEGLSNDVVVEAKDRETAVRDIIARTLEEYTFDELDTSEGKIALTDKLKMNIDKLLSTGRLRKVRIKTAILKP